MYVCMYIYLVDLTQTVYYSIRTSANLQNEKLSPQNPQFREETYSVMQLGTNFSGLGLCKLWCIMNFQAFRHQNITDYRLKLTELCDGNYHRNKTVQS